MYKSFLLYWVDQSFQENIKHKERLELSLFYPWFKGNDFNYSLSIKF